MRSLRPPPKVTPPKPPAHLFEPREDVAPIPLRLEKKMDEPKPYNFEDDVKFQMQQLENEMKMMLAKDSGDGGLQPFAAQLEKRGADPRTSYGSQGGVPEPFPERVNPSDWKAKGFPSEYAYMKATGQLDAKPNPQPRQAVNEVRDSKHNFDAGYGQPRGQHQGPTSSFPERINPADWKAKGFASEFAYMKATGQLDIPSSKPIPPMFGESANPNKPNYDPRGAPSVIEPPGRSKDPTSYEKDIVSPARRKGGAMQNLYVGEDELRKKFANQHSYSDQLQQQAAQQRQAREAELQDHRGVGNHRGTGAATGGADPWGSNAGLRLPSDRGAVTNAGVPGRPQQPSPQQMPYAPPAPIPTAPFRNNEPPTGYRGGPETDRYDPAMLAYGAERSRAGPAPAEMIISPTDRRQSAARAPGREEVNTGLLLGMDKNSEKALKRAKQEEYKRQLDQMKPKQVDIPVPQPRAVDTGSYLPTGARPAPERYDPRIPPAPVPQPSARSNYRDVPPSERYYAEAEKFRDSHDPYAASLPSRMPPGPSSYSTGRDAPPQARYPPAGYGSNAGPGSGPVSYGEYPGPAETAYVRGVPNPVGAAGGRGGPSPMRQMPPGRMEDPYYPQNAPYAEANGYQELRGPAPAAPSSSFHASLGAPAESAEKRAKREQQEQYRRELEAQMEIKKAQKSRMKKEEQDSDQRFLKQVIAAEGAQQRGKNGQPQGQQQDQQQGQQQGQRDWQAPPPPQQQQHQPPTSYPSAEGGRGASDRERDGFRAAPAVRPSGGGSQYADDIAAEYELLKAKMAQLDRMGPGPQGGSHSNHPPGRGDLFERDEEPSYRSEARDLRNGSRDDVDPRAMQGRYQDQEAYGGRGGDRGSAYDREPQAAPGAAYGRPMNIDTHAGERDTQNTGGSSPFKSPNEARTRFMKDIYGGDLITHSKADPQQGGNWRGAGSNDDRKRQIIAEQRAALDQQVQADRERKEQEKKAEEEKDRLKEEKDRSDRERVAEFERKEKEKKDQFNENAARDLAELQARKEKEALARKGRGATKTTTFSEPEADSRDGGGYKPNRAEPAPRRPEPNQPAPSPGRGKAEYEHIESPMRDIINQQRQAQLQMMMASHQQEDFRGGGGGVEPQRGPAGISLYESTPADEMDRFLRERKAADRQQPPPQGANGGGPAGGYPPPRGGYEPSPYSSYSQPPGGPGQYPYPPPQQYQAQYAPPYQQPPPYYNSPPRQQHPQYSQQYPPQDGSFYPARGTFYADNDLSLVAESRLLPANPFSSSDMLSSLVPIGATAHANATTHANANPTAQRRSNNNNNRADLEKSMASDSTMVFLGQRTPLLEPGAARPSSLRNQEPAVAGMPSRNLHPSSRPSSAATAKLSDVIQEANRVLEQEKRDLYGTGNGHGSGSGSGSAAANRPSANLMPKKDYSAEPTFLGENDGISTYHRPDHHSSPSENVSDVPKNRIFLNQKQRYEDDEPAAVEENEVAGFDENLSRSIHLIDSAEKAPRLQDVKNGAEIATQISDLKLAKEMAPVTPTAGSPVSVKSSSRKKGDRSSKKQPKAQNQSPRSAAHSPRASTEVNESMDSPDKLMPSLKYDPPFSPAPVEKVHTAQSLATSGDIDEAGEVSDAVTQSLRRNVLDANAHLVKPTGDHRSPRQRALENKQAREAALAAGVELPARKHVPIEEEIAELQSPQVPRLPRKNILDANESILQAPADNRYRSPRQRALDRENSKKSDASPRPVETEENMTQESQEQVGEEEEKANSLYLPYVRSIDDSHLQQADSPRVVEDNTSKEPEQQQQEADEEEEEIPLYLPYVRSVDDTQLPIAGSTENLDSASVDDTRFNEWPAEENYVDVDDAVAPAEGAEGEAYPSYEAQDYTQDPEYQQGEYEQGAEYQQEEPVVEQTEVHESAEYPEESVDNYQDVTAYQDASYEQDESYQNASYENQEPVVEGTYDQEYEQEYYGEAPEVANEDPQVAPEYAGAEEEQDLSYAVESGLQYAENDTEEVGAEGGTEVGAEVEAEEPAEYVEGEDHAYTFESMLPEYYEDEEEEEELVVVPPKPSSAKAEPQGSLESVVSPEVPEATPAAKDALQDTKPALPSRAATPRQEVASHMPDEIRTLSARRSRPSSRGTHAEVADDNLPADFLPEVSVPSQKIGSRPASGRPRTASRNLSEPEKSEELIAAVRPRSSRVRDASPELVVVRESALSLSSRPPSGRPRTGRQLSTAHLPDVLDSSLSVAAEPERLSVSSRPPTAGRPRTGTGASSADVRDSLERALSESSPAPVAASRPTTGTGRPRSAAPTSARESEPMDALAQALETDASTTATLQRSVSRPGTGQLLSTSRPHTGARRPGGATESAVDALDQALADSTPVSARLQSSSRPNSSGMK